MRPERRPSGRYGRVGASRPNENSHSGDKAVNPRGLGTESPNSESSSRFGFGWATDRAASSLGASGHGRGRLGPPTPRTTFEYMPVMQEAVEHGRDCCHIAQQFSPVFDGAI